METSLHDIVLDKDFLDKIPEAQAIKQKQTNESIPVQQSEQSEETTDKMRESIRKLRIW